MIAIDDLLNKGNELNKAGKTQDAINVYQSILKLTPDDGSLLFTLGRLCIKLGHLEQAIYYLEKAKSNEPTWPKPLRALAYCYQQTGKAKEALSVINASIKIHPDDPENYRSLFEYYRLQGAFGQAIEAGKKLLKYNPKDDKLHTQLGTLYSKFGFYEAALFHFSACDQINSSPHSANSIGTMYNSLNNTIQAKQWFIKALKRESSFYNAIYGLVFLKMKNCDWSDRCSDEKLLTDTLIKHLSDTATDQLPPSLAFNYLELPIELHQKLNEYRAKKIGKKAQFLKKQVDFNFTSEGRDRLRIGYISPDLRDHSVGRLIVNLFKNHDRNNVSVHAYSLTKYNPNDTYAERIKQGCDLFHECATMTSIGIAQLIYLDKVDILVDLAGYTAYNRPEIVALQPAPVQIQYLGFPGTMGMEAVRYILADNQLIPDKLQKYYTEEVSYIPTYFLGEKTKIKTHSVSRNQLNLPSSSFVFMAFNRSSKIDPIIFESWMRILTQVDNSVLWLSDLNQAAKNNLNNWAHKKGINPDRLIFAERADYEVYLQSHQLADLFLDTLHYSAGSTAVVALASGLPVLTCTMDTNASRMGASALNSVDLQDLICSSLHDYEQKAIDLANNPAQLKKYKNHLSNTAQELDLFNAKKYAHNLEKTYKLMWSAYQITRKDKT